MDKKIICFILFLGLFLGCGVTESVRQNRELPSTFNSTNLAVTLGAESNLVFNPSEMESALPAMGDLPLPEPLKKERQAHRYTGIIKNKTNYEVSVPGGDSGATLIIPAKGWIEYTAWSRRFNLTAYHDGKPFYCMKIYVNPKNYPFMCKKYDFMMEIVKAEPAPKAKKKMKRAIKKKKAPEGVEKVG